MTTPFSLYRSEIDAYINDSCIDRIVAAIAHKKHYSSLTALFAPLDSPRTAIVHRCRERAHKNESGEDVRKTYWIPPFRPWDMMTIGNLSLALLWHIYRSLPQEVLRDEKIIYKLGKISVTLPALTEGLQKRGNSYSHEPERHTTISNKALPPEHKSSVSSIFSACEQISELSETFKTIGKQISAAGKFDALVVPIIDIDLCFPEQAISLLFSIRNFICSESIAFMLITDQEILTNFLISLYDNTLHQKKGQCTFLNFFDDWVHLPPPHIENIMQTIDIKLNKAEKESLTNAVQSCGVISLFTDYSLIHQGFKRFNSFIINTMENYSTNEYIVMIVLFLFGAYAPDTLRRISLRPDLQKYLSSMRQHTTEQNIFSLYNDEKSTPSAHQTIAGRFKQNRISDFPAGGSHFGDDTAKNFLKIIAQLPSTVSDNMIAEWLVRIIPFL